MTIIRRCDSYGLKVWDRRRRAYRWLGTFRTEREAMDAEHAWRNGEPVEPPIATSFRYEPTTPVVYFVAAPSLAVVKIGFSIDLKTRLADLSISSPVDLRLIKTVPGSPELEREFHRRFRLYRTRGEWFRIAGALEEFLLDDSVEDRLRLVGPA